MILISNTESPNNIQIKTKDCDSNNEYNEEEVDSAIDNMPCIQERARPNSSIDESTHPEPINTILWHFHQKDTNQSLGNTKDGGVNIRRPNTIKALSGHKFQGDKLTTYGDVIEPKVKGILQISGFNTNSITLDEEIEAKRQASMDLQVDIQCYQEVCWNTRRSPILQQFLKDTKKHESIIEVSIGAS